MFTNAPWPALCIPPPGTLRILKTALPVPHDSSDVCLIYVFIMPGSRRASPPPSASRDCNVTNGRAANIASITPQNRRVAAALHFSCKFIYGGVKQYLFFTAMGFSPLQPPFLHHPLAILQLIFPCPVQSKSTRNVAATLEAFHSFEMYLCLFRFIETIFKVTSAGLRRQSANIESCGSKNDHHNEAFLDTMKAHKWQKK
eukprot:Gb_20579 [translate_table: standard]